MKKQIKIYSILFLALLINNTNIFAQKATKNSCSIEIIGPDSIDSFTSNITYSLQSTISGFPLPTGYIYQWSTSNNSAIEIVSGNGTPNLTINYFYGEFELNVFMIKDATSSSCCISKTITQADLPPNYTIKATYCPQLITNEKDHCDQAGKYTWGFQLVNENGVNVSDPFATWINNLPVPGTPIDEIISTSGTSMTGKHKDCAGFEVVCKVGDYYYYGLFSVPDAYGTCNNFYEGYDSGYYIRKYIDSSYQYIRISTGSRHTLIENGFIN
jgi:hypothetical protein